MFDRGSLARAIAEVIRKTRKKRKMRLADLSLLSGVAIATLSDLENGNRDPRLSTVQRVFDALDIRPNDVFETTATPEDQGKLRHVGVKPYDLSGEL